MKARLVLPALLAALLALAVAGCGGGGDSGGAEANPASVAPAGTPLYIEATILPEGETKANIDALAERIAGIEDLGGLIESELEKSASDQGQEIDFEKEIKPWLGEKGAIFWPGYKEGDFSEGAIAVQVTDPRAAESFVDDHAQTHGKPDKDGSYKGVHFKVDLEDEETVGVVGELLAIADSETLFRQVVDASKGESLADEDAFTEAISNLPDGSAADLYFDIGGIIKQAGAEVDPNAKRLFENAGFNLDEATAVASVIPGSDNIEIDVSTNAVGDSPPSGDASKLLASLPADAVAALATPEFGQRFLEGIDQLDENGIPGELPPHQLKKSLKESGFDVESLVSGIGDVAVFVEGSNERNLRGALVLEAEDAKQATNTVSNLGLFIRAAHVPGVTALNGKASGFSIRSPELGPKPLVVAAEGSRIAVGYGAGSAVRGLAEASETLGETATYKEAVSALGGIPISGFVDGPAALKLVSSLVSPGEEGFREAKRYLTKIDYLAFGSQVSSDLANVKLIVGVGK